MMTIHPNSNRQQDLTVKGESIERIYGNYIENRYVVNRRYQRKLVWTLDEKRQFIDSILKGYPIPIVLLAERKSSESNDFEIIDGMQRLNAIMGFLENEYAVNEDYFDLNTMAQTKALHDDGRLTQKSPLLDRESCVRVASYIVPLSIYEFSGHSSVDEVFRRINSGGKKLSRQELRVAGSTGHFATAVRVISSTIRGDVSFSDVLLLNEMKKISITNRDLEYGIDVETIFWIQQGILTKEQVRESKDEEIVADILAFMLLDEKPASRSEYLDDYFGFTESDKSKKRLADIEQSVQKQTIDAVTFDFQRIIDQIRMVLVQTGKTLGEILFGFQQSRAPRYFQVVFLAFHKLMISEGKEVQDHNSLIKLLTDSGNSIHIPEGGRWGAEDRRNAVNSAAGRLAPAFQATNYQDPAKVRWVTQFENILRQSYTEQTVFDFKQGFLRLDNNNSWDDLSFEKILKTLVAMSNNRNGVKGYVLVGIVDKESDAQRIVQIFNIKPRVFERFFITGVEHEAMVIKKNLDQLFQFVVSKIESSTISDSLKNYIARNLRLIRYYEKSLFIFETLGQTDPSSYDGKFYVRHGTSLKELKSSEYADLFRRFQNR